MVDGICKPSLHTEQRSEVVVCFEVAGVESNRQVKVPGGEIKSLLGHQHVAQHEVALGQTRP